VLAQTEAFVDATQFNAEPTRFYKDAPMYSPATRLTEKRPDMTNSISGSLQQKLKVEALLADARDAYEKEDFFAAENIFNEILQQNEKNNFSALSGLYQSQLRANHLKEAENTFGNLVDSGFDAGNLSVKFLFKVRSTEFLENNELATQYPIWVRQIAQKLKGRNQCLAINGHASRSGNEEYNKQLSLQRSIRIITLLNKISPSISTNLKAYGKGYSENIVGSGTNDALDAIDRRVEFSIIKCS
jgi:outer membrane protein OmpA-like peptidoglycan-associated protein